MTGPELIAHACLEAAVGYYMDLIAAGELDDPDTIYVCQFCQCHIPFKDSICPCERKAKAA